MDIDMVDANDQENHPPGRFLTTTTRAASNGQLFEYFAREEELFRQEASERPTPRSLPSFGVPLRAENPASQVYLAIVWQSGILGAAVYNTENALVDLLIDMAEKPPFEVLRSLISVVEPLYVVASLGIDERLKEFLTTTCSGTCTAKREKRQIKDDEGVATQQRPSADGRTDGRSDGRSAAVPILHLLPGKDFGLGPAKQRIGRVRIPTMPEHIMQNSDEILLYLASIIDFRRFSMVRAFGGLLAFMDRMPATQSGQNESGVPIATIRMFSMEDDVAIDQNSLNALRVFHSNQHPSAFKSGTGGKEGFSLFALFNHCRSGVGKKLLKLWFSRPTRNLSTLRSRHQAVRFFMNPQNEALKREFEKLLSGLKDITTTMARLVKGVCTLGDWAALEKTSMCGFMIAQVIEREDLPLDIEIFGKIRDTFSRELARIGKIIHDVVDYEASEAEERFVVKPGVAVELDDMKRRLNTLNETLSAIATEELARMNGTTREIRVIYIPSMGYLLALDKDQDDDGTSDYTIPGLEFVFKAKSGLFYKSAKMHELDNDESNFGDLTPRINDCERVLMIQLREVVLRYTTTLFDVMAGAAELDCYISIASTAVNRNFIVPEIGEDIGIDIQDGRHPLQEMCVTMFVPNSTDLGVGKGRVNVLTGPNMCGKSVYLKQVGIIVFLAHVGCPVPAAAARIGLVDKIFTRLLSEETVAVRQSAFLIDLTQVGMAVNYASERSLIILDEFGKGTRSSDGLALLASILKHFISGAYCKSSLTAAAEDSNLSCSRVGTSSGQIARKKCPIILLATHFHALRELIPPSDLVNYLTLEHMKSDTDNLVFLYKVKTGVSVSSSYAVETSRAAGFTNRTLKRIVEITEGIKQNRQIEPLARLRVAGFSIIAEKIADNLMAFDPVNEDARVFLDQTMALVHRGPVRPETSRWVEAQQALPERAVPEGSEV
ncbi:MutS protein-like protein 5 [Hypsibius exemplaris]|uniref:MutS protein-like protein 5 n=1 Tax=Hypsibius exemplaris TaxID=2072580 RepID=A0A1W0WRI1_HYPEX|nr:MutS protein-like protein 5 [Hypsibius exemplaris]